MCFIAPVEAPLAAPFAAVSLEVLNRRADMLTRLDNKYILSAAALQEAAPLLAARFDLLEIDGRRAFTYETCYFDTPKLRCYFDHHRGRRRRVKLRMRAYRDSGLCYLEVKLKDRRDITVKRRQRTDPARFGQLDPRALAFLRQTCLAHYDDAFEDEMARVLDMRYQRMTLVAKSGGEWMTIDSGLRFTAGG